MHGVERRGKGSTVRYVKFLNKRPPLVLRGFEFAEKTEQAPIAIPNRPNGEAARCTQLREPVLQQSANEWEHFGAENIAGIVIRIIR